MKVGHFISNTDLSPLKRALILSIGAFVFGYGTGLTGPFAGHIIDIAGSPNCKEFAKLCGISVFGLDTILWDMNCWFPEAPTIIGFIACAIAAMSICYKMSDSAPAHLSYIAITRLFGCLQPVKEQSTQ